MNWIDTATAAIVSVYKISLGLDVNILQKSDNIFKVRL